jgi:hypothetical protein
MGGDPPEDALAVGPPIGESAEQQLGGSRTMSDQNAAARDQVLELGQHWAAAERSGDV